MKIQEKLCGGLHQVFGSPKTIIPIQAVARKMCTTCHGLGELEDETTCPVCGGDGCLYEDRLTEDDFIQDIKN